MCVFLVGITTLATNTEWLNRLLAHPPLLCSRLFCVRSAHLPQMAGHPNAVSTPLYCAASVQQLPPTATFSNTSFTPGSADPLAFLASTHLAHMAGRPNSAMMHYPHQPPRAVAVPEPANAFPANIPANAPPPANGFSPADALSANAFAQWADQNAAALAHAAPASAPLMHCGTCLPGGIPSPAGGSVAPHGVPEGGESPPVMLQQHYCGIAPRLFSSAAPYTSFGALSPGCPPASLSEARSLDGQPLYPVGLHSAAAMAGGDKKAPPTREHFHPGLKHSHCAGLQVAHPHALSGSQSGPLTPPSPSLLHPEPSG